MRKYTNIYKQKWERRVRKSKYIQVKRSNNKRRLWRTSHPVCFEAERKGEIGRNYQFTAWIYFSSYMIQKNKKQTTTNVGWEWVWRRIKLKFRCRVTWWFFWRCDVNFIIAYISNYQSLGILSCFTLFFKFIS